MTTKTWLLYTVTKMEWFKIDWRGPYPIDTAHTKPEAGSFGIYAIHEVKGKNTKLLYIGETYWQGFGKRLKQHKRERISYGRVQDVERALIYVHMPPFNTVSKRGYLGRDILICNLGKVGKIERLVCTKELRALLKAVKTAI